MKFLSESACLGVSPDLWHPDYTSDDCIDKEEKSKQICYSCPVRLECLEYAMENEPYGTWGGLTELERDELRICQGEKPLMYWSERRDLERSRRRILAGAR